MYWIRAIEETELTQIPEQIFLRQIGYISISHLGYTLYVLSTVNRAHNLLDIFVFLIIPSVPAVRSSCSQPAPQCTGTGGWEPRRQHHARRRLHCVKQHSSRHIHPVRRKFFRNGGTPW